MDPIRLFSIISWILLPTVMFGGYSLLRLMAPGNSWLTPRQTNRKAIRHIQGEARCLTFRIVSSRV
jgi:hypothetical protein